MRMENIRICAITNDIADKACGLIFPEVLEALKEGLYVTAFAAVIEDIAVGGLAGVTDGGVFDIASIYVLPEYRRRGVGRALIEWLEELLTDGDDASVYIRAEYTMLDEDNKTLYPFFLALNFIEDDTGLPMYYTGLLGDLYLDDIPLNKEKRVSEISDEEGGSDVALTQNRLKDKKVLSFTEAGKMLLRSATAEAASGGFPLPEGGLSSERLDADLSFCVAEEEKIRAYIAVEPIEKDLIKIPALWSSLSDPRMLMTMLSYAVNAVKEKYPPQTKIVMLALNRESERIIEYLFDDPEPCSYRLIFLP